MHKISTHRISTENPSTPESIKSRKISSAILINLVVDHKIQTDYVKQNEKDRKKNKKKRLKETLDTTNGIVSADDSKPIQLVTVEEREREHVAEIAKGNV